MLFFFLIKRLLLFQNLVQSETEVIRNVQWNDFFLFFALQMWLGQWAGQIWPQGIHVIIIYSTYILRDVVNQHLQAQSVPHVCCMLCMPNLLTNAHHHTEHMMDNIHTSWLCFTNFTKVWLHLFLLSSPDIPTQWFHDAEKWNTNSYFSSFLS